MLSAGRFAVVLGVVLAIACRQESIEPAPWTIPIPPGTPVRAYAAVLPADRIGNLIELTEDLTLAGASGDTNYSFYQPADLAVDDSGRMYVYDAGNARVQVFDNDGLYVRTIGGREGQGPADLPRSGLIAIAGDQLMVAGGWVFLRTWHLNGELREAHQFLGPRPLWSLRGSDRGDLVASYSVGLEENQSAQGIGRITPDGAEILRYAVLADPGEVALERTNAGGDWLSVYTSIRRGEPTFALSSMSDLYVTAGNEYQVLALNIDGGARWALRVAWPREPLTEQEIAAAIERVRKSLPDARRDEIAWPESMPALSGPSGNAFGRSSLRVDGHRHLYVFPFARVAAEGDLRPVDVYSRDGELLYAGLIADRTWYAARENFVYAFEMNADTSEEFVVRYRLVEPF